MPSPSQPHYLQPPPEWEDHEKPTLPGSPGMPYHRPLLRFAYLLVGILTTLAGGLGTAFISANQYVLTGDLALTPSEFAWLSAVYVMSNISANLLLFKFRQQFGITRFAEYSIIVFVAMMLLHLLSNDYTTALIVRAVSGFTSAPLSSLGMLYTLQAFSKKHAGRGLCVALGLGQLALPLAWMISPSLTDTGDWKSLYIFELGISLCTLACILALKLPTGVRIKVIEKFDFLTFALLAPGFALVCAVLAQGRIQWWLTQPWMAYSLIAALGLILAGGAFEYHRSRPLLQIRWLGSSEIIRFVIGAFMLRFLLSEQTYTATTMLRALGMGPDQMVSLYAVIFAGIVAGFVFAAVTFGPRMLMVHLLLAVALIACGSLLDQSSTTLTRPHDMFLSQFLLAAAGGLFIGPLLLIGITRALARGADYVITFIVLFSITQSLGSLAGSALYGTFQVAREQEYSAQITRHITPTDPLVAQRLQQQTQAYNNQMTDPTLRTAQGRAALAQSATLESGQRAYNDAFTLNMLLACGFFLWSLFVVWHVARRARRAAQAQSSLPSPAS
jgi:MFS family permease